MGEGAVVDEEWDMGSDVADQPKDEVFHKQDKVNKWFGSVVSYNINIMHRKLSIQVIVYLFRCRIIWRRISRTFTDKLKASPSSTNYMTPTPLPTKNSKRRKNKSWADSKDCNSTLPNMTSLRSPSSITSKKSIRESWLNLATPMKAIDSWCPSVSP